MKTIIVLLIFMVSVSLEAKTIYLKLADGFSVYDGGISYASTKDVGKELSEWEKNNPMKEISCWVLDNIIESGRYNRVVGVWITYREKK